MAQKNRATLKSYFQQGDIPTENEYIDILGNLTASNVLLDWSGSGVTGGLLDGVYRINTQLIGSANGTSITFVNEVDFNNQQLSNIEIGSGDINNTSVGISTPASGAFTTLSTTGNTNLGNSVDDRHFFIGGVTGSSFLVQDVNGKGDFYAHEITVGDRSSNSNALTISTSGSLFASSSITSSANISASGTLYGSEAYITGHITASGNISASGTIFADNFQSTGGDIGGISFADEVNITGNITASGNISSSGTVFANALDLEGANIKYIASQNILKFGDAVKLGIGAGVTEAVGDLTISSDGANANLSANVGNIKLGTSAGNTIIQNNFAGGNILLQSDKAGSGQQGGVVLISGSNTHISLDVRGNITASNISASGTLFANTLNASELTGITHITASGNISASGDIIATTASIQYLDGPEGGEISFTGGNPTLKGEDGAQISLTDDATISGGNNRLVILGNISASGTGSFGYVEASGLVNRANDANTGLEFSSDTVIVQGNNVHAALFSSTLNRFIVPTQIQAPLTASSGISASHLKINSDAEGSFIELENGTFGAKIVTSGSDYLVITSSGNSGGFYYDVRDNHLGVGRLPHISNASGLTVGGLTSGSRLHMSSHITASGNISASGDIFVKDLNINYDALPTSDPSVKGQVYRNGSNQLFVSAG